MLVVGRIISGLSVGLASAVVPIYQAEITAPAIRGRMVSLQQCPSPGVSCCNILCNSAAPTSTASRLSVSPGPADDSGHCTQRWYDALPESPRWLFDHG